MPTPSKPSHDRFTLPGDIPDAAYWGPNDTYDDAVRKREAARARDAAEDQRARGCTPSHPAGRGWTPQSRDLGIPGDREQWPCLRHNGVIYEFPNGMPADPIAKIGGGSVFTRELRVRFLDHLAFQGNARAAAMRVGVSHETVYRARRRDAVFAALWDAALVHARKYSEQVLTTRALDGIEVEVWHRGERVGHTVRYDTRLLLAHQARLDRQVESDHDAMARAARFDELLAQYAGHEVPEAFEEAALEARIGRPDVAPFDVPPTRDEYCDHAVGLALDAAGDVPAVDEEALEQASTENAGKAWDDWQQAAFATLDAVLEGEGDEEEEEGDPSSLSPEGGAGGGPVDPPATNTPTPDRCSSGTSATPRKREGDASPVIPAEACSEQSRAGTQRPEEPGDPLPTNPVTRVNTTPQPGRNEHGGNPRHNIP